MTTRPGADAATGLYQPGLGLRMFRLGLGTSQKLWPALAVRAAVRVFCTPLPPRWLRRPRTWSERWNTERWPFEDAELTVYALAGAATGPVALLVHGWAGHAGQLLPLADALARQGWQPVLVDLPAHGASAGSTSSLPQFARAIDYVVGRLRERGERVGALVAHSLGASAAAHATSRGLAVERLVLLAPAASARAFTHFFAGVFGLDEATRAAMQQRIEAREGVLMRHFEPRFVAPGIHVPTLVVHDRADRINAFADGQAFATAIEGARLVATEGLGHRRMLKDEGLISEVVRFCS